MPIFPLTAIVDASFRTCRNGARGAWLSLAAVTSAALLLTGCATTKAATNVDGPPLAVPPAPERVVVPAEEEPLASITVGPDTPLASVPRVTQPPPASTRPRTNRTEGDARSDAAQAAASPATAPQVQGPTAEARPELRVVPTAAQATADQRRVQDLLNKADADRRKVEQLKLSTIESNNLRASKRFSEQAVEALKDGNLQFAFAHAQKAAELAAALAAR